MKITLILDVMVCGSVDRHKALPPVNFFSLHFLAKIFLHIFSLISHLNLQLNPASFNWPQTAVDYPCHFGVLLSFDLQENEGLEKPLCQFNGLSTHKHSSRQFTCPHTG